MNTVDLGKERARKNHPSLLQGEMRKLVAEELENAMNYAVRLARDPGNGEIQFNGDEVLMKIEDNILKHYSFKAINGIHGLIHKAIRNMKGM